MTNQEYINAMEELVYGLEHEFTVTMTGNIWTGGTELTAEECRATLAEFIEEAATIMHYRNMALDGAA